MTDPGIVEADGTGAGQSAAAGACYAAPGTVAFQAEGWLRRVAPYNRALVLEPSTAALLVIDMQRFFLDPASPTFTCGGLAALPGISRLITAFRRAGRPVLFTQHAHHASLSDAGIMAWWWEGMCIEGTEGSEVHAELRPLPHERVIVKRRYSAFYNTDLDTVLRCLGVRDLVVCGIMTNMCCESTARDAYYRDYRVFFPADATGPVNEEMHTASLLNLAFGFASITTVSRLLGGIQAPGPADATPAR